MEIKNETLEKIQQLVRELPNDSELGAEVRKLVLNNPTYLDLLKSDKYKREQEKIEADKEKVRVYLEKKNVKLYENIIFPFESKEFREMWFNWVEFKRSQHKFSYKSELTIQAALNKLSKLSKGSEEVAIKIILQSIEGGWKGFFELKTETNGKAKQRISEDYLTRIANDLLN